MRTKIALVKRLPFFLACLLARSLGLQWDEHHMSGGDVHVTSSCDV